MNILLDMLITSGIILAVCAYQYPHIQCFVFIMIVGLVVERVMGNKK